MNILYKYFLFIFTLTLVSQNSFSQVEEVRSVFANGSWYKIGVTEDGIYKVDRNLLRSLNINTSSIDPGSFVIFGSGGKMLPQELGQNNRIKQVPIKSFGLEDGSFDRNDYILFYGQGPDSFVFNQEQRKVEYTNNIYADTSYYFIGLNYNDVIRVENENIEFRNGTVIDDYFNYQVHERDIENLVKSGRHWYGEKFDLITEYTFPFEFENEIVNNKEVTLTADVLIRSESSPSSFDFFLNETFAGEIEAAPVPFNTYSSRGRKECESFVSTEVISSSNVIELDLKFNGSTNRSAGYINYLLVSAYNKLVYRNEPLFFQSFESIENAISEYQIETNSDASTLEVWDITNPFNIRNKNIRVESNTISVSEESSEFHQYVMLDPSQDIQRPVAVGQIPNQDLWSINVSELLIITAPSFISQAEQLADLRRSHDGLTVNVVNVDQVYNDFSSGSRDITGIRNFIKHIYDKDRSEKGLKYVLLFGKGSYDFKEVIENNINNLPIYQSRNSVHPIFSYASDDYFGLMDEGEGVWDESFSFDYNLDIAVGRIPAKNQEEAFAIVDKLEKYAYEAKSLGDWRKSIVFVADDVDSRGESDIHIKQAEKLSYQVDTTETGLNIKKIYVDAFEQEPIPGGERVPEVNEMLNRSIEDGSLIINFTGHGGETIWTSERILDIFNISSWDNKYTYPLFFTATCEFGRNDDPERDSGAEVALLRAEGGAIGLITTTRPVFSQPNFDLNKAFYNSAFKKVNGQHQRLGDIFLQTKNEVIDLNSRNFMLLGDPSMKLAFPEFEVKIDQINGVEFNETLSSDTLRPLGTTELNGTITNPAGVVEENYNGKVEISVFGQSIKKSTLGYELNNPIEYEERSNVLFTGKATVKNGVWSISFTLPENTPGNVDTGKISLYAWSDELPDASGGTKNILVGGESFVIDDNLPPSIKIYLGDSTFTPGDIVNNDTRLLSLLSDEQGIDISLDTPNSLYAILDDTIQFDLREYYTANENTQKSGWVDFPVKNLQPGEHTVTVFARDLIGNENSSFMTFSVAEKNQIILKDLFNYPNPFTNETKIVFTHNRSGEDLEITLMVYSPRGDIVKEQTYTVSESSTVIDQLEWDGRISSGKKLEQGIYYYRVLVRSLEDGATSSMSQKFVIY